MATRKIHLADPSKPNRNQSEGKPMHACNGDHWYAETTDDEARVTCPGCLAILHRRALAARPADAPVLALEKFDGQSGYRFTYRATMNGEHLGFIVYDGAYGRASWKVCVINLPDEKDKRAVGFELDADPEAKYPRTLNFKTKEAALMAIPGLRDAKRLRTLPELEAHREDWNRRMAAGEARRKREDEAEAADRQLARDAVASMLARSDLSNLERSGLESALIIVMRPVSA